MSDLIKHVTSDSFDAEVLQSTKPVLVDYWAPWCGPCKMIAPILDEIAPEYADKLQIIKADVQDHPDLAARFGVRNIPTLMIFKDGKSISTKVGHVGKTDLINFIESNI